jgi:hypothetical protein
MILVQGCSFTYGQELPDPEQHRYSTLLREKLGTDNQVLNLAAVGKDNFVAYQEIHTYLLNARLRHDVPMPKIIIWQLTDTFRRGIPAHQATGSWKPNKLESQISTGWQYLERYAKSISWRLFLRTKKHLSDIKKSNKLDNYKLERARIGLGTRVVYTDPTGHVTGESTIGDGTFILNELTVGLYIHTIQEMCKKMNIRLVIMNYYGTPIEVLKDPIYESVNRDNYLVSNSDTNGMYNHLMWKSFDRPDDFHFNIDAHDYQADLLYDFIVNQKRVEVEVEAHPNVSQYPVFNYT